MKNDDEWHGLKFLAFYLLLFFSLVAFDYYLIRSIVRVVVYAVRAICGL